ncbi:MAG TPA: hypothetical protein VIK06_04330 [Candidatus Limnocylindrales bacterium]
MEDPRPVRRKMRTYTLTALLAVFVGAAALAIVSRVLPGRLSRLMRAPIASEPTRKSGEHSGD